LLNHLPQLSHPRVPDEHILGTKVAIVIGKAESVGTLDHENVINGHTEGLGDGEESGGRGGGQGGEETDSYLSKQE
jgi:hypothetical protein